MSAKEIVRGYLGVGLGKLVLDIVPPENISISVNTTNSKNAYSTGETVNIVLGWYTKTPPLVMFWADLVYMCRRVEALKGRPDGPDFEIHMWIA